MSRCDTTDLTMLMASSRTPTVAVDTGDRVELRPYATEELVTLVLRHSSLGLAWSHASPTNSCCSDSFGAQGSGDARAGRARVVVTERASEAWKMASVRHMPTLLSGPDTEIAAGQDIDRSEHKTQIEIQSYWLV